MKKLNDVKQGYVNYAQHNEIFLPQKATKGSPALPAGIYELKLTQNGDVYFQSMSVTSDDLLDLPNTVSDNVLFEVDKFWTADTKRKYTKYGLVHKRGILMHGAPGTGKTCTIIKVMERITNQGGITLFNPAPELVQLGVSAIREIQPGMPVLVVYEEFEDRCEDPDMLSLLDGQAQVDNIVYLATTNYISQIPSRIKSRPSRFATVIEVGPPSAEVRRIYFDKKLHNEDKEHITELVSKTEGFVLDQLKDIIVSVFCLGLSVDESIAKIHEMQENSAGLDDLDESVNQSRLKSRDEMIAEMVKKANLEASLMRASAKTIPLINTNSMTDSSPETNWP